MAVTIDGTTDTITATASSAVTTPSATIALNAIGTGQTWQVVTGSRTAGTTYTNSTGKPIMVSIQVQNTAVLQVNSVVAATSGIGNASNFIGAIVPAGATYVLSSGPNQRWSELRD
jgi:hypothetical protein